MNLNGKFHSYHFGEADNVEGALLKTGALVQRSINTHRGVVIPCPAETSDTFIAYVAGGCDLNKLHETMKLLRSKGVKIGGYLPTTEFRIDGNGQLYWSVVDTMSLSEFDD